MKKLWPKNRILSLQDVIAAKAYNDLSVKYYLLFDYLSELNIPDSESEELQRAYLRFVTIGGFLARSVILFGNICITRVFPYWESMLVLTDTQIEAFSKVIDAGAKRALDDVVSADGKLRKLLGVESVE